MNKNRSLVVRDSLKVLLVFPGFALLVACNSETVDFNPPMNFSEPVNFNKTVEFHTPVKFNEPIKFHAPIRSTEPIIKFKEPIKLIDDLNQTNFVATTPTTHYTMRYVTFPQGIDYCIRVVVVNPGTNYPIYRVK